MVVFRSGGQRAFIESVEKKYSLETIAEICSCSTRTIRDWRREKFPMQLLCARSLSRRASISLPKDIKIRSRYARLRKAGRKGAEIVLAKYGRIPVNESHRKARWQKWWLTEGRFKTQPSAFLPHAIYNPPKSVELAELVGIMMGDGGLSNYQATITLHHTDDRDYIAFVAKKIEKLFRIKPAIYHRQEISVCNVVVSRKGIVAYLHSLGLPIGNKIRQGLDIPEWIKKNEKFALACVRGLIDTDGSVVTHSYVVKGKRYRYKKISFCTHSELLRHSVARILSDSGMSPHLNRFDVRLDSITDVKKYFSVVGSSNSKHLERYAK